MRNIINIVNLTKTYNTGHTALNNINLQIKEGCIMGLLGPNGAGKSTLIRILNQIIDFDQGRILVNNTVLDNLHLKLFGYLPEERGMYKDIKIEEQLLYFAQLKGVSRQDAKANLNYWLSKFDIKSWKDKKISELSKGMQQKVQFIASVIHRPSILVLDEPFSGFDPLNALIFKKEILSLSEKDGCTIILSTHNMSSVEEICDNITLIAKANIILNGRVSEIKKAYNKNDLIEIVIRCDDIFTFREKIAREYSIIDVKSVKNIHSLKIKYMGEIFSDDNIIIESLFRHFNQEVLLSYRYLIPSLEDVFITAVNSINNDK